MHALSNYFVAFSISWLLRLRDFLNLGGAVSRGCAFFSRRMRARVAEAFGCLSQQPRLHATFSGTHFHLIYHLNLEKRKKKSSQNFFRACIEG